MRVLGVSALFHDAAAALCIDGEMVVAVQEERLSRRKNDASLPLAAARACLAHAGLRADQLDGVAYYEDPFRRATRATISCFRNFPHALLQFPAVMGSLPRTLFAPMHLADGLGIDAARVTTLAHHQCHAAAGFYASGYESAAVVIADGVGEATSSSLWSADAGGLQLLHETAFPHSLGLFYAAVTAWLGFEVNEGEYKVMGLAAFGEPRHAALLRRWVWVEDGAVRVARDAFAYETETRFGYGPELVRQLGPPRSPTAPWDLQRPDDRARADVAASAQLVLEECLLALAKDAAVRTGQRNLILAGGVALNAKAIGVLHDAGLFERIYVPPGAGDAGGALGAAWLAAVRAGDPPRPLSSAFLGPALDAARGHALAIALGLEEVAGNATHVVAHAIARGEIVAVARDRLEFGPRALGHRSLLAPAGPAGVRERINRIVKEREAFRPFAPVLRARDVPRFFHGHANDCTPYMTTVLRAREPDDPELAAVIHADGTARVQSVEHGFLADVLDQLETLGRCPVVLNTSLNGRGEPICAGVEDAITFFRAHQVDLLLLGDRSYRRTP